MIANVAEAPFLDYVDAEGIVQPIQTIKLNALESGMVQEVIAEEGGNAEERRCDSRAAKSRIRTHHRRAASRMGKQRILYEEKKAGNGAENHLAQAANTSGAIRTEPFAKRLRAGRRRI